VQLDKKCRQICFVMIYQLFLCYLCQGDLRLDPPMEKFVSLVDSLFDKLPYLLSESAGHISGLDPTCWPHYAELVKPTTRFACPVNGVSYVVDNDSIICNQILALIINFHLYVFFAVCAFYTVYGISHELVWCCFK